MGIDNFLLMNRGIESRGIRFGGLLQRKRFAMTKKMSSLFDEVFITKIKGSHQKKRKALIMTSKCDIMKDILRTKKGGYPHVKTECQHLNSL